MPAHAIFLPSTSPAFCSVSERGALSGLWDPCGGADAQVHAVEFPAVDSRVVAVGGIAPGGSFWDDWPNCPYGFQRSLECGSNYGPEQELMGPAKWVLSTAYTGAYANATVRCGDPYGAGGNAADGIGLCTGTSMSSPAVAGTGALVRTANPLFHQGQREYRRAARRPTTYELRSGQASPPDRMSPTRSAVDSFPAWSVPASTPATRSRLPAWRLRISSSIVARLTRR